MIKGIKASQGIAIGKAYILKEAVFEISEVSASTIQEEIDRFDEAKEDNIKRLEALKIKTLETIGEDEAEVFEAHKQLIMDPVMTQEVLKILNEGKTTEYAYQKTMDKYIEMFKSMDNDYMRERAADLKDIKLNMLKSLSGSFSEDDRLKEDRIVVTYDLTPSETVKLDKEKTLGFVTEIGGETSHSAIIARTLNIPAVVGCGKLAIKNNDVLILDGQEGVVYVNPSEDLIAEYKKQKKVLAQEELALDQYKNVVSKTRDGKLIEIAGNIASVEDIDSVIEASGDGVGLFRSEFLYMNRNSLPSEEEQFQAYKSVLEKLNKPITIRTMDIGGDKQLDYLNLEEEMNPFLGYRAIRICLREKEIFISQLRALLRASAYGQLRIMFPMIGSLEELMEAKSILSDVEKDLLAEGFPMKAYEVGIMIEVPSAALIADILAEYVDFFSIGTNDLIQYTTAVDRMNQNISDLYSPYHPAFVRLLKQIVDAGHAKGIEVGMCGNVAGQADFIPYLLDIGLDELSMSPNMILKARSIVNNHQKNEKRMEDLLKCTTKKAVEAILN